METFCQIRRRFPVVWHRIFGRRAHETQAACGSAHPLGRRFYYDGSWENKACWGLGIVNPSSSESDLLSGHMPPAVPCPPGVRRWILSGYRQGGSRLGARTPLGRRSGKVPGGSTPHGPFPPPTPHFLFSRFSLPIETGNMIGTIYIKTRRSTLRRVFAYMEAWENFCLVWLTFCCSAGGVEYQPLDCI